MNQPLKTGKRIVSRGEYAKVQGKRIRLWLQSAFFSLMGICIVVIGLFGKPDIPFVSSGIARFIFAFMGAFYALIWFYWAQKSVRRVRVIEPVTLLTCANSADLPALDSRIRASEEPVQQQQAVLLRAATENSEKHEEQLVKASAGGTEQA